MLKKIPIKTEYIKLGQLLKYADVIQSGGEEKSFISTHKIFVNNIPENRRGKKIVPGDVVEINGDIIQVTSYED
ncbi:MAG: S4 domain-containing protein YaaA [Bacilli bacterium]|nr:S4 domain-containing protein YaaA [Bacilli bacterium]MDD4584271.1 S4 domain-containing protein YaaA [Bacilli bacterium]